MANFNYQTTAEKLNKLAEIAQESGVSVNQLIDDVMTRVIEENEAYRQFKTRAVQGNTQRAMEIIRGKTIK